MNPFPSDYLVARSQFREAAAALDCRLEAHAIEGRAPGGEDLTIDVALSSGGDPSAVIIVSSGIHGVEGFFGSAVQVGLLRRWASERETRPRMRWIMLHALNPYGFAWRRRVNEHNIDLNRNLLLEGEAFRGSPDAYPGFDALLNPRRPPSLWDPVMLKIAMAIARHGLQPFKQAVASGQYDFPQGLFYGGDRASATHRMLDANYARWVGQSPRVVHLDLHTGLGPWATCKLLVDHPMSAAQERWLGDHFGADSYERFGATGVAYTTRGSFGLWGASRMGAADYLYAAAEFGTYRAPRVLATLIAENQCHHWGGASERAKRNLVEAFCPRSAVWRSSVLEQGMQLVDRAAAGLMFPAPNPQATASRILRAGGDPQSCA
jgi:hypothetical protein